MRDSEVRGIILRRLYDVRHMNHGMINVPDGLGIMDIPPTVLGNCAGQLAEQNLIKFGEVMGRGYRSGWATITAYGVDVVEENARPSIAITLDHSVTVQGSSNVVVGHGNNQTVSGETNSASVAVTPQKNNLFSFMVGLCKSAIKWLSGSH